jgi:hypothetical protein
VVGVCSGVVSNTVTPADCAVGRCRGQQTRATPVRAQQRQVTCAEGRSRDRSRTAWAAITKRRTRLLLSHQQFTNDRTNAQAPTNVSCDVTFDHALLRQRRASTSSSLPPHWSHTPLASLATPIHTTTTPPLTRPCCVRRVVWPRSEQRTLGACPPRRGQTRLSPRSNGCSSTRRPCRTRCRGC